jgi:predicted amidohydrolase
MQGVTTPGKGEDSLEEFMKKAITIPGPETDVLAEKAREYGLFIAGGGVVEKVPEFPDRWFNTAFIIGPTGEVILKYHKWHIPATIGLGTSPHDMMKDYSKVFGDDIKTRFPVVDTEIGKLGTMTCHDGATPEVSRALGFNGCEVICHPVALQEVEGVSKPWDFWTFTRRTRAHDNMCYLLGSNWGIVNYDYYPKAFCPGHSLIIDYTGMILRQASYPAEQILAATLDIESLREHRSIANHNMWVDVRTEGFREMYEQTIYPPNLFPPDKPPRTLADKVEGCKTVFAGLYGRGQFTPPYGYEPEDMPGLLEKRVKYAQETGRLRKE